MEVSDWELVYNVLGHGWCIDGRDEVFRNSKANFILKIV